MGNQVDVAQECEWLCNINVYICIMSSQKIESQEKYDFADIMINAQINIS